MPPAASSEVPVIHCLTIERFRGIQKMVWYPGPGVNLILGGGDVGKTTILEAVALLLSPTSNAVLSDSDYWERNTTEGFRIEAVMSLPDSCAINQQAKNAWPWCWDGTNAILPTADEDKKQEPELPSVYLFQVRATPDFDIFYEVIQPNGDLENFSQVLRRNIGLVKLSGDDRNDRDLRLVFGSALERLISDKTLRSRIGKKIGENDVKSELNEDAIKQLDELSKTFQAKALPAGLSLGLVGGAGLSINALLGLTATEGTFSLPLTCWGAGTRRLAALEIADAHQKDNPIMVVDEIERGLEPYRQRTLMTGLLNTGCQVFVTTHSSHALSAGSSASIWYMNHNEVPKLVDGNNLKHINRDPEAYLSRITIVAEGATEIGFLQSVFSSHVNADYHSYGVCLTDAGGHDIALGLLEDMAKSGIVFGGFVDNEGHAPTKWRNIKDKLVNLLFQWDTGCLEENVIKLLREDQLEEFIKDEEGMSGARLATMAERIKVTDDKRFASLKSKCPDIRKLMIEAATGFYPKSADESADKAEKKAWKNHARTWFKSVEGGKELAAKVQAFGLWNNVFRAIGPFINAVRSRVNLPEHELPK